MSIASINVYESDALIMNAMFDSNPMKKTGGFIMSHRGIPIAGWFIMENHQKYDKIWMITGGSSWYLHDLGKAPIATCLNRWAFCYHHDRPEAAWSYSHGMPWILGLSQNGVPLKFHGFIVIFPMINHINQSVQSSVFSYWNQVTWIMWYHCYHNMYL